MKSLCFLLLLLPLLVSAQGEEFKPVPRQEASLLVGFGGRPNPWVVGTCGFLSCADVLVFEDRASVSTGIAYHYLLPLGPLWLGAGGSFELMGTGRAERYAALTGIAEYRLGRGRVQPVIRMEAGAGVPVGSRWRPIANRTVGELIHPSVGLLVATGPQRGHELLVTAGYRFASTSFSSTDLYGRPAERDITYRRLSITLASRF